ncbi:MAG: cyclic pyranopterin monophosphate synthase MoaC [Candidatus Bathyarchaeota archaeon]
MSRDPVRMIDVSGKETVPRRATAVGRLRLRESTVKAIKEGKVRKGDPLTVAEVASILAVKKTPELIPLCHPVPVDSVDTRFTLGPDYVEAACTVAANYRTGVEMEALTGVAVALLNVWDMVKYLEKDEAGQYPDAAITEIRVTEKVKGR